MLFNIDQFKWEEELIKDVGIGLNKLPEAVPPGSIIGYLGYTAANKLGLPDGIPVIAAGGDQQCAAVGLGVVENGLLEVNTGTGSFILTNCHKPYKDVNQRLICSASSIAGNWVLEAGLYYWFNLQVVQDNIYLAKKSKKFNTDIYRFMNLKRKKNQLVQMVYVNSHFAASAAPY